MSAHPELRDVNGPGALGGSWRRTFDLLYLIAATEFKRTYFGTVLGYLWTLCRPLMLFGVLLAGTVLIVVGLTYFPVLALGPVVERRLPHDPAHVVLAAHARPRGVVQPLEPEPPALVGRVEPRRPVRGQRRRQPDAVPPRQVTDGRHPHRAGEVQVEVGLGQVRDGPLGLSGRVAHSTSESSS